jgi:NADH:ubiquinone oxidoreductase subunit K
MGIMALELFILPLSLFTLSMLGISINRSNIIMILLCLEMMLLSIIISFLFGSYFQNNDLGQLGSIFIMTMAAIESAIGLSIMIVFSKLKGSVSIRFLNVLKG